MKNSKDIFGQALLEHLYGSKEDFYFEISNKTKIKHPLKKYYRDYADFTKIEKKLISMCKGNILDVGFGTGNYIPSLMKQGKVLGIDISPNSIKIAREKYNLKNIKLVDIFDLKLTNKFDTIVLLENNLGMAGSIQKTKILLNKLIKLLDNNGQILTNAASVPNGTYVIAELVPVWKNLKGKKFKWISFNVKYLRNICKELDLNFEVAMRNSTQYLARITKK